MPKEIIHNPRRYETTHADGSKTLNSEPYALDVRWSKDGSYMQIGAIDLTESELPGEKNGLYVSMTRQMCNDLIRHARRARDQAFGKDE